MPLANVFAPMGYRLYLAGAKRGFITRRRPVQAARTQTASAVTTLLTAGDCYTIDASGFAKHAGNADTVRGVVVGIELAAVSTVMNGMGPVSADLLTQAMAGNIIGCEDPLAEFFTLANSYAASNNGNKFNLLDVADDQTFRQSRQYLDVAGGAGTQFTLIDMVSSPANNSVGANAIVKVKLATPY